jgi:GH24 family phage-related lysozyme (muramidase)
MDAVAELWRKMPVSLLEEDTDWIVKYRSVPVEKEEEEETGAISVINAAGLQLIKDFEGLRLDSYICPAGVLTIGYGSTGEHVYSGQHITEPEAEELLRKDLWRFEDCVSSRVEVLLTDSEYAALVSFAFNCGCGALQESTLLRRLNAGEPKPRVFSEELPKWVNGPDGPLPGLVRRREAELELALDGSVPGATGAEKLTPYAPYAQQVTPSFTYGELTLYQPQRRFLNQGQCDIAIELCEFLEKARAKFGPLKITSGHRPPDVNAAVGGANNSEHLFKPGCGAVDVYPIDGDGQAFEDWCDENWPYSVGYGWTYRQFTHLGIREGRPRVRWDY